MICSLSIVPSGLSVAKASKTALHNAAYLNSDQANPLGDPSETRTFDLTPESQAS